MTDAQAVFERIVEGAAVVPPRVTRSLASPVGTADAIARLKTGSPCVQVRGVLEEAVGAFETRDRHEGLLRSIMRLLRLAVAYHPGVPAALDQLEQAFTKAVADSRSMPEAQREWLRALSGAVEQIGLTGIKVSWYGQCSCFFEQLGRIADDRSNFTQRGHLVERKIYRYLVWRAERRRSRSVRESQRQIAEAVDIRQATVCNALRRLESLDLVERCGVSKHGGAGRYILLSPMCRGVSTNRSARERERPKEQLVDTPLHPYVHRLFGSQGLGPGPAETLSKIRLAWQALDRPQSLKDMSIVLVAAVGPPRGHRIPHSLIGDGVSLGELQAATGVHRTTIQRHIKRLASAELIYCLDGLWWQYRYDPDEVAGELGIPDTLELKAARHVNDRRSFYVRGCQARGEDPPRFVAVVVPGGVHYVNRRTGELHWTDVDLYAAAIADRSDRLDEGRTAADGELPGAHPHDG